MTAVCGWCNRGFAVVYGRTDNQCGCFREAHLCQCHRYCTEAVQVLFAAYTTVTGDQIPIEGRFVEGKIVWSQVSKEKIGESQ